MGVFFASVCTSETLAWRNPVTSQMGPPSHSLGEYRSGGQCRGRHSSTARFCAGGSCIISCCFASRWFSPQSALGCKAGHMGFMEVAVFARHVCQCQIEGLARSTTVSLRTLFILV